VKTNDGNKQLAKALGLEAKPMTKTQLCAYSLVDLAKAEGTLDVVDNDLRLIKSTLAEHLDLKTALTGGGISDKQKLKVVEEVFKGRVSPVTIVFLQLLAILGQISLLPAIADEFSRRLEQVEEKIIAEVTTAVPMEPAAEEQIRGRLKAITGQEVTIRAKVDPNIVGGLVVRVGDKLLDGSIHHQLERLRKQMLMEIRGN
jgi:F-type H+-transporting ATPase subunit delta